MNSIDAFILVGGRSSRMGRDKASTMIGGMSMIERGINAIKTALSDVEISLVDAGKTRSQLFGCRLVIDANGGRGAWSGLDAALSHSRAEWTFVLACDYPLMLPEIVRIITEKRSDEFDAIVPKQPDGLLQPLCAMYRTSVCAKLAASIMANDTVPPLRMIFDNARTCIVPFRSFEDLTGAENAFLNVNTKADLEKAVLLLDALP